MHGGGGGANRLSHRTFLEEEEEEEEEDTGRAWELYQVYAIQRPTYVVPYGADEVASTILDHFDTQQDVCVACILLPFHARPAWPKQRIDVVSPDVLRFYYCAGSDCGRPVNHIIKPDYRMSLQLVVGVSTTTNRSEVGWIPRLMCASCAPLCGDTSAYPMVLDAHQIIQETLRGVLQSFNDAVSRRACYICEIKLPRRSNKGAIPICNAPECYEALEQMGTNTVWRTIFEPTAYQRMVNLVQYFRKRNVNLSKAMRWPICHNVKNTCLARGNSALECAQCTRVEYCSEGCAGESEFIHGKYCEHFATIWDIEKLMLWSDRFVAQLSHLQDKGDSITMSTPTMVMHCKCTIVGKEGMNQEAVRSFSKRKGKHYYACALGKGAGCGFFRWSQDVQDEYEENSFCVADSEEE
jgi:hypothetical protein